MNKTLITTTIAAAAIASPLFAGEMSPPVTNYSAPVSTHAGDFYTGLSVTENSTFGYLGANYALNSDYDQSGWFVGFQIGYGEYDYNNGVEVDGDIEKYDLTIGYQVVSGSTKYSLAVGPSFVSHELSPNDPNNSVEGDEFGAVIRLGYSTEFGNDYAAYAVGDYSTGFDEYYVQATVTKKVIGNLAIGPQVAFLGNDDWEELRYGLTIDGFQLGNVAFSISGGFTEAETSGEDQDGAYGAIHAIYSF